MTYDEYGAWTITTGPLDWPAARKAVDRLDAAGLLKTAGADSWVRQHEGLGHARRQAVPSRRRSVSRHIPVLGFVPGGEPSPACFSSSFRARWMASP